MLNSKYDAGEVRGLVPGPSLAWMPASSLHGCTCSVSWNQPPHFRRGTIVIKAMSTHHSQCKDTNNHCTQADGIKNSEIAVDYNLPPLSEINMTRNRYNI